MQLFSKVEINVSQIHDEQNNTNLNKDTLFIIKHSAALCQTDIWEAALNSVFKASTLFTLF